MTRLWNFFHSNSASGVVLMLAAVLAVVLANSPAAPVYAAFSQSAHFFINDFLMAIFFLFAGLEIKRELVIGALSSRSKAMLPIIAAVCGMAVPAIIYLIINRHHSVPGSAHGWAIPSATDIAFALGVMSLLGRRVPGALKILLLAIAVIDDLGAIIVIALFYAHGFAWMLFALALAAAGMLVVFNRFKVQNLAPYLATGLLLWWALLGAGIHPTIAGVILGFCIPMTRLNKIQDAIHPYVNFGIMPLFGFANAGVSLAGIDMSAFTHPVTAGVMWGLVLGKPIGIFGAIYICVRSGLCHLSHGIGWRHIWGLSLMCGIGFTMALFIGALAFPGGEMDAYIRLGVMGGSVLSALLGYTVLVCGVRTATSQGLSK